MNDPREFQSWVERLSSVCVLADKPEETPEATARVLWHLAAGRPMSVQASAGLPLPALDAMAASRLAALAEKRLAGVPLAHLTGVQRFMGLDMLAGKEALIPRKETELLGYAALARLRETAASAPSVTVMDLCTGSGNLAVALAQYEAKAKVFASDLSAEAVSLARKNAARFDLGDRLELREGDLLAPFDEPRFHGAIELMVCNPPYISSRNVSAMPAEIACHEPRLAFDGGALGVNLLIRLIGEARRFLRPGGTLAIEVGLGQGPAILRRLRAEGFADLQPLTDERSDVRALLARAA